MKQRFYLLALLVLMLSAFKGEGQYHITSVTRIDTVPHPYCDTTQFYITTDIPICAACSTYVVKAIFGNGTNTISRVWATPTGSLGNTIVSNCYYFPGNYTVKFILYSDTSGGGWTLDSNAIAMDSAVNFVDESFFCHGLPVRFFYDIAGTGVYNYSDPLIKFPIKAEVSKNGVPVDTVSCTSGLYYLAPGVVGDVYSFRIISMPSIAILTSPVGGIIYDTIGIYPNYYGMKYFGFKCSSATAFDLSVDPVIPINGIRDQKGSIYVTNISCDTVNATVTMNFSPKYVFDTGNAFPAPSAVVGNTITWNLTGVTMFSPARLWYTLWDDAGDLVAGDTVQEHIQVTPITGDSDPTNNSIIIIDTVKAGVDPNEMSVTPSGYISSGTQLKYTIGFENTGNDTAFNISVYDTLSDNVDVKSLNLIMASAVMNIATLNVGGHNIVKFDFPNINLLDSSHHGQCDGAVIFTINAKDDLPAGTTIFNHAGIFFDYNPVVMTDTVEDIIGFPASVATISNASKVTVFPNPATDELTVKTEGAYSTISITNTVGQSLLSAPVTGTQTKVSVKSLPAGLYYLTLRGESGVRVVKFEKMD